MLKSDFEDFFRAYPRRVAKKAALKAYLKARRDTDQELILAGVARYRASLNGTDPKYIAHPSTWLNAGRWADEYKSEDGTVPFNERGRNRMSSPAGG